MLRELYNNRFPPQSRRGNRAPLQIARADLSSRQADFIKRNLCLLNGISSRGQFEIFWRFHFDIETIERDTHAKYVRVFTRSGFNGYRYTLPSHRKMNCAARHTRAHSHIHARARAPLRIDGRAHVFAQFSSATFRATPAARFLGATPRV